jgi:hypothetical protein
MGLCSFALQQFRKKANQDFLKIAKKHTAWRHVFGFLKKLRESQYFLEITSINAFCFLKVFIF